MLILFFIILGTPAEWVGNLTVYPSEEVYKGLRCLSTECLRHMNALNVHIRICRSSNCTNHLKLYSTRENYFTSYKNDDPYISVIITKNFSTINSSLIVFALPEKKKDILNTNGESILIQYKFDYHCNEQVPLLIIKSTFLALWIGLTVLWIYNNYSLNRTNAELFHKFSTIILVFKVFNLLAVFSTAVSCPIKNKMTEEFYGLFEKQTESLYQTSFFAYLLLLSKGWVLIVNSMNKKEFNYLVIVIIFIYILDSAVNIIEIGVVYLSFFLYSILLFHISSFSLVTLRQIQSQISVINETGMDMLLPISRSKRLRFIKFLLTAYCFFIFKLLLSVFFDDINELDFDRQILHYTLSELVELSSVFIIFFLYRARKLERFYSFEIHNPLRQNQLIPFYESKEPVKTGPVLAVNLPGGGIKIAKVS